MADDQETRPLLSMRIELFGNVTLWFKENRGPGDSTKISIEGVVQKNGKPALHTTDVKVPITKIIETFTKAKLL